MHAARLFLLVLVLAATAPLRAQQCSGGRDGGMDATGHQCNDPAMALIYADPSTHAAGGDEDPVAIRNRGLEHYGRGDYNAAVELFRRAGERGDLRSAEMIVLMHRYNAELYGGRLAIGAAEAKRWASVVARQATVASVRGE